MNVLSLFDGISTGQIALERSGIKYEKFYASEIDKYAISITQMNYPKTIQLGDVNNVDFNQFTGNIDLLMGGCPCQSFSRAGLGLNFDDPRGILFFKFVEALETIKPKYFLMENVKMKKEWLDVITNYVKVEPIFIDSAKLSAQSRLRAYWTNIPNVEQPEDKHIYLKDIVLSDVEPIVLHNLYGGFKETSVRIFEGKSPTIRTSAGGGHIPSFVKKDLIHNQKAIDYMNRKVADGRTHWDFKHHSDINNEKSATVVANFFKGVPYNVFKDWDCIRKFSPEECEALQTIPMGYTAYGINDKNKVIKISNTQRFKCIGNAWTCDVISHILNYFPRSDNNWT